MPPGTRSKMAGGRSSQRRQYRKSYREDSTDVEDRSSSGDSDDYQAPSSLRRERRALKPGPSLHNVQALSRKRKSTYTHPPHSQKKKVRTSDNTRKCDIGTVEIKAHSEGPIPRWHTLPYHILFQIFHYASQPFFAEAYTVPTSSVPWLLRAALVCKSFAEPALSVLYYAPPLWPPSRAHGLVTQLQEQNDRSTFNYRAKVRYLDVEAPKTLFRKWKGHDPLDMAALVAVTPQLRGIGIHQRADFPKQHASPLAIPRGRIRDLLQSTISALQQHGIRLQEWKWNDANVDLLNQNYCAMMESYHGTKALQRLTILTIVGLYYKFTPSSMNMPGGLVESLASAICVLSSLQELHLARSPLINGTLLPLLPRGLKVLSITDCPVDATMMTSFLTSHGAHLHRLILDHNKSLNLSFLVVLSQSCPALESLTMDLTYLDSHSTFSDNEPRYDSLLLANEIPTWPRALQQLELLHLRKWNNEIAENFFNSLVGAAEHLPNLRSLNIKASLNESGWRERVSFRDRWAATLQKVFSRVSPPPNPHLRSIDAFKAYKAKQATAIRTQPAATASLSRKEVGHLRRLYPGNLRSSRSQPLDDVLVAASEDSGPSDEPIIQRRRSSRLQRHDDASCDLTSKPTQHRSARRPRRARASDEGSSSEDSAIDDNTNLDTDGRASKQADPGKKLYIQGMCDVVRVSVDNLRPSEEQLDESDFLDEEISGDEDWNGADDIDGNDGYAW